TTADETLAMVSFQVISSARRSANNRYIINVNAIDLFLIRAAL
ncbi:MAG: hypothetical protein ACI85X_001202, partial [Woeseiaceae bacterium]